MAARKAATQAPATVEGAWRMHKKVWHLVTTSGHVGARFTATSKAGVRTTGVLVELAHQDKDSLMYWTVKSDKKDPTTMANDRALKAQSQAAYWASEAGQERAAKIAAWRDAQEQEQAQEPIVNTAVDHLVATGNTAPADVMDAIIADAVARAVAQALAAQGLAPAPAPAPKQARPVTTGQARAQRTIKATMPADACQACGKGQATVDHKGAGLKVCKGCAPADADTLKMRHARLTK